MKMNKSDIKSLCVAFLVIVIAIAIIVIAIPCVSKHNKNFKNEYAINTPKTLSKAEAFRMLVRHNSYYNSSP